MLAPGEVAWLRQRIRLAERMFDRILRGLDASAPAPHLAWSEDRPGWHGQCTGKIGAKRCGNVGRLWRGGSVRRDPARPARYWLCSTEPLCAGCAIVLESTTEAP